MNAKSAIAVAVFVGLARAARAAEAPAGLHDVAAARTDFILHCGGCHGFDGVTNARAVPDLRHMVGAFLSLPEGRAYLGRLPNVAFSMTSDERLADVLNYTVFVIGSGSAPAAAKPYSAAEVGALRKKALTGAPLRAYRDGLVDMLIRDFHAPEALRLYGKDNYGAGNGGF